MKMLRADAPYLTGIAYQANGPIRYQALCFDGLFKLNTGVIVEFAIEITEVGEATSIATYTDLELDTLETYLALGQMLHVLDKGWEIELPESLWYWTNTAYSDYMDVYQEQSYSIFSYLIERLGSEIVSEKEQS